MRSTWLFSERLFIRSFQSTGGDTRSCKLVNQSLPTNNETKMKHIVIKDNKGKKHTFSNLNKLIKYLDSFKMSFLPDGFTYKIKDKKND